MAKEIRIDALVIHPWKKQKHRGDTFSCDFWDCPHKIRDGDIYWRNLYPDGNEHTYCVDCSCTFMAQAVNAFLNGGVSDD